MSATTAVLDLDFHPGQKLLLNDPSRFVVCVAGRRFGKTEYALKRLIIEGLRSELNGYSLQDKEVWYVGPTFQQSRRIAWNRLKRLCEPVMLDKYENECRIQLVNKRWIALMGADDPDSLHGMGLSYAVLDEFAKMKPQAWEVAVRPMLTDVKGGALFIGTPRGKNHFFKLVQAHRNDDGWGIHHFSSLDNPFLDPEEIEYAKKHMTTEQFREQYMAKFTTGGGKLLKMEWMTLGPDPKSGEYAIAVDLAGFAEEGQSSQYKYLDQTAIAAVKITDDGQWWVKEIRHGRWGVRETATRILKACQDFHVRDPGIEKGALMNAVLPYLGDQQRKIGFYIEPIPLTHGGTKKVDRIVWALGGRMEHGRLTFNEKAGPWLEQLMDEMSDFPNKTSPDDLLDALAYIDQLAPGMGGGFSQGSYIEIN